MDGMSSEANEENDNTERPVRRRHSSILKPPRSPLQDLRSGNETVQESNALRNKKSSRRVSFANTIKVFQTESHTKTVRKSEITETEAGENVLFTWDKNSEDNYCEITAMNTLLCAPIQTQIQEREFSSIEHNHEGKHANDQTVIFSAENQMDLTASHTVLITKDLSDCSKNEKSTKIDTTSFLANLKRHTEDSRMKKELKFSTDQNTSEKKINSNDFIKRLKTGKYNASPFTGGNKENSEIPIYSKESNNVPFIHQICTSLNVDEKSSNVTRIFRGQDDGMNFTQCHTANIQTLVPTTTEANLREFKSDITIYGNDCMDLTINHTLQVLPSADTDKENQTQTVMDIATDNGTKALGKNTIFKNNLNVAFPDPSLNPEDKVHITRNHIRESETCAITQTSDRDARTLSVTQGSICYSPLIQGNKTVFYSTCNDAMELTKCLSSVKGETTLLKHDNNYLKVCPNPDAIPCLIEKTVYSGEDSMDITKSHTVTIDNQIFKQNQPDVQIAASPISEKEMMLQNYTTGSEDRKMNVNYSLVPGVPKGILQWSLPYHDEDSPPSAVYNEDIATNHNIVYSGAVLDKQAPLRNNRNTISSENLTINHTLQVLPSADNSSETENQTQTVMNIAADYGIKALGKNTIFKNTFSNSEPLFSSERQSDMKNYNIAVNSHIVKSVLGQNSILSEPLRKSLGDPTHDRSHDKLSIFSEEEQAMDLTKSHTVVIGFGPAELQEISNTNVEPRTTQLPRESIQTAVKVEKCDESPVQKTEVFMCNDKDMLEDKDIQKPVFLKEKQNVKNCGRKSVGAVKIDKTMVFLEDDENDMDITKSYTVEINHKPLLDKPDSHLVPLAGTSKSILYACWQDDMEITRSHTTALECKPISPDEITSRPMDKTLIFVNNHDELEMTKSHTVFIDFQAEEKTILPDRTTSEQSRRKSLQNPKATSGEENVFFSENDRPAPIGEQVTVLEELSNIGPTEKAIAPISDENMDMSKLTTWKNVEDIQKPGSVNEPLSVKSQRRKSLRLKNDKAIAFSENDKNDMDITQSCMEGTNSKSALEEREDFSVVPLTGISKTVLYACGQDDMEITRSHTIASAYKTVSLDKVTIRPMDKTVMFVDNNDLEVTKSQTVFIDCQATEKILKEYPKFGVTRENNLSVHFPKDDSYVEEITKNQALAVENKVVLQPEPKDHMIPLVLTNTFSRHQSEMEIIKFHEVVTDEKVMEKVVDQVYTLETGRNESCRLNSADTKNVDFAGSVAAICGSSDNSSSSPDVISPFDNLENNVISLCDKDKASKCLVQNDLAFADNLASEYFAPCPLLEKEEVTPTDSKGQIDCAVTLLKDQDLQKEPQNLVSQTVVHNQNLGEMTKLNSKRVSFKLPKDQMEAFADIFVTSQPYVSTQQPLLTQKGQSVNEDESKLSNTENKSLNIVTEKFSVPTCSDKSKMLNNEKQCAIVCKKELKENIQPAKCNTVIDNNSNTGLTTQVVQANTNAREAGPILASNVPCCSNIKLSLNNLNGKPGELDFQTAYILPSEELLKLENKALNNMTIVQSTELDNINITSSDAKHNKVKENKNSHNGDETTSAPLKTVKDKTRCSLGIFLPRLPNKRNCSVTGIDDLEQIPVDTTALSHSETQPVSSKDSGIGSVAAKLNLSPSQYINEENLPIYSGEINSSDSISIEIEGKALIEKYQEEISPSEDKMEETSNSQKRTWVQEEDDVENEKKIRKYEIKLEDSTQHQEIFDHHTEGNIDKNANSVLIKRLSRTPSSSSSSLDSVKADGTSLDFSMYRNSQMESQFLGHTICEESLREKLKDGRITVREFFILLQVHILIQKPRESSLPAKFTINTSPTPEDLILRQYIYGPKIQIYREDCEVLHQKIEELKVSALNQDKLLTDVNRNLWENMRHCSDEELKAFGIHLNKIKSRFTKMTKVFTHQGKVALYSKLVQSAQNERERLHIRIDEMNNILKKTDNCLTEVEIEIKNLEDEEKDNCMEEWHSEMRAAERDLEELKAEEEELQRKLLELQVQKEQTLAQIDFMQKQTNRTEELLDHLSLSEWEVIEWSDDQAVFTFIYDTIELTITFGEPVVGVPFLEKPYRKIADLNFQSLLDEDKAPSSSLLVHKLIFQYIEEQESWKKICTTQHQVPKMLQEFSLVVSHCRLLGEEIEFLKKWGPNYNLMDIYVNNTELRLLFSSSAAFAKFEITLSLSAHYPLVPLPFTIQNHLGNTGQDEIASIISKVPLEDNYLKNIVKQISQDLLQDCDFYP
ncbi:kinetochore scaffold 1 isoform X1 [Heterocephalus glaber]|uniref:Kinetochore scaffold 1 isoform X1 n=1 Tax=Heterocephalus glaber TaxID=10181 RepID=A0AAX6R5K7_HETGA|nr:kinetochore scaffold 1 isoform X1 [Heterocephalus glaber]XP_021097551.1 kinetochore scaffold 1 isoform X1 [Heterocephalus glaber]XP_021097552.1 kinetochore scaffold 1 isoform X1 [Heterocephalus glaber]XP_021097553.1 kinetochore scaffold 1 isoform X1 [Heterocephalus glaber]XP_021097554.1 kinetochore scaffold 1 isoform X1 [Heterocephalus glaber]